ncbi:efflux RND transporter periplasmic adaptor subunit [Paraburkholderia xenovorans]|uniref:efflux RND transporter periplasmic adaptor subunit n=1 Tax=Paraburkholderia xenovorans TaxID=36873 RepID=UPI0038BB1A6F
MKAIPLLCLGVFALVGCSGQSQPPAPPPPAVDVVTVQPQSVALTRPLVGRLSAYLSSNVTARVSGVLIRRDYKEGGKVKAGQVLFEIDPTYYQAQLDNDLGVLGEDNATYLNDRINAERYRKLLPAGSVSQQTVDNADATVRVDAAKVKADEALVASARINLGYTKVTSPISGIAGQQQVTVGAVVGNGTADVGSSGTLLTTVNQIDPLYVNFTMSSADLLTLRESASRGTVALSQQDKVSVQIVLPDGTKYGQAGTLDFADVAVNPTTGAVNLRATLPNAQGELLPGMYVNLSVDLGEENNVFLVPQQAIQRDTVGAFALVVDPSGKVARKDVTATDNSGNNWIVTSGLTGGDRVIVTGLQGAHEGGQVKASQWKAPAAGSLQRASAAVPGNLQ